MPLDQDPNARRAYVIALGNEKGGTGKSTTAMHIAVGLMQEGYRAATLDLDPRQGTLTQYIGNRRAFAAGGTALPIPEHAMFVPSALDSQAAASEADSRRLDEQVDSFSAIADFVILDCPGSDSFAARHALSLADTLITPVNESFVDVDLLGKVGPDGTVLRPSAYSEIVWRQKQQRAMRRRQAIDWVVMRNRRSTTASRNQREVGEALAAIGKRVGFRLADGFSERVIFRQLFLKGLTVLDLRQPGIDMALTLSHIAARQEIRSLIESALGPVLAPPTSDAALVGAD
jgi:chromosome partitioning protein